MSADYHSSNPFRRKAPPSTASFAAPEHSSILNHVAYGETEPVSRSSNLEQVDAAKKATKKVRVQSPPPPSPSIPDSSSTIGEETYSIAAKPPTPIPQDEDDPFDSFTSDTSDDEAASRPQQVPANPFQKTLEMMEHPEREGPILAQTNITSPGRASLDVEAFKRLLMTGNAGLGMSTPPAVPQAQVHHGLGDGGSSTDTSSLSRQSIFEAIQEAHPESPRTSHEMSELEDDRRGLSVEASATSRKIPPPPSSRHGKLIKVELRDDPATTPLVPPSTLGSGTAHQSFGSSPLPTNRSQTDLNKPLPPAPTLASHDSDRESIFDREAAGKTPEPPSPSASIRRKVRPVPPLTRRHSQLVSDSKLTRLDTGRLSPKAEEESRGIATIEPARPRSDSGRAPPPPPSRRPASIRGSSHPLPLTSVSPTSLPPVPPPRGLSRPASGRPPSIASLDISTAMNKRSSVIPPPPPPSRHGRISLEAQSSENQRQTSGEHARRSIDSVRRGSEASSISQHEGVESSESVSGRKDILADLSALQREIDALRIQSEKERVT